MPAELPGRPEDSKLLIAAIAIFMAHLAEHSIGVDRRAVLSDFLSFPPDLHL